MLSRDDVLGITMPVVKHSALVRRAEDLPFLVEEAFRIAREGRPGPVLLDIPKDVLNQFLDVELPGSDPLSAPELPSELSLQRAQNLLKEARKPLAYVGGGGRLAQAVTELREFLDATGMPTVQTLAWARLSKMSVPWACSGCMVKRQLRGAGM